MISSTRKTIKGINRIGRILTTVFPWLKLAKLRQEGKKHAPIVLKPRAPRGHATATFEAPFLRDEGDRSIDRCQRQTTRFLTVLGEIFSENFPRIFGRTFPRTFPAQTFLGMSNALSVKHLSFELKIGSSRGVVALHGYNVSFAFILYCLSPPDSSSSSAHSGNRPP